MYLLGYVGQSLPRHIVPFTIWLQIPRVGQVVPDFNVFSPLLRITVKYAMLAIRVLSLEVVHNAYPQETFVGVTHPNEDFNLSIQRNLKPILLMAYCTVAQTGADSLMDGRLPWSATLSPEVLRTAVKGRFTLCEMERDKTHRLVFFCSPGFRRCCI